jgi:hypothetical protein
MQTPLDFIFISFVREPFERTSRKALAVFRFAK